jgi:CRP-like cAMP-binding protein
MLGERTPCERCPFHTNSTLRRFTPEELAFVARFKVGEMVFEPGETILTAGTKHPNLYTVLSGWTFRYKLLDDGRRQILNVALPSDFLGLQATVFDELTHSVEALTPVTLCVFARLDLWTLYEAHPRLAFDMTWLGAREENLLGEHLLTVGRRSATEKVAAALMLLFVRAEQLGLTIGNALPFPLTQQHLADLLGLSLVHTNKTIQKLVQRGIFAWAAGRFTLLDRAGLATAAHFEFHEPTPRPFI